MGRLCNDELKDPNAVMKKIFTDRDHLCVFALKNIVCGEEIRYNYGPDDGSMYWRYKPKPAKICQARRESGTEAEHKTTLLVTAEDKLLVCQTSVTDVDQALRESGTEAEHEVTLIVSAEDELLVGQTPVTGVDHALRESGTEAEHEATLTVTTGDKLLVCQTSVADVDQALRESGTEAEHENTLLVTAEDELLVGQTPITDVDQALRESGTEAEHEATLTVTAGDKLPVCQTTKSIDSVQHSTVVVLAQQTANAAKVDWYSKEEVVTCAEVGVIGLKTNVVLKFEDIRKKYRPQIAHFDSTESGIVGKLPWMNRKLKDKYLMKHKKQTGYCECCEIHYDYFKTHVASFSHRMFALTTENYKKVDCLISELPTLDQLRSSFDTVSKDTAALTVTAEDKLLVGQTPVTDVDHALRESGTEAEHEATLIVSAEDKLLIGQTPVTDVDQALRESGTEAEHEATLIVSAEDKLLVCQTSVTGVDHVLRESGTEAEHEATLSVSAEDKLTVCQTPVTDVDPACPQSGVITSIRLVDYSDSSQMSDCCAEMQTVTCFTNMDYVDDSHSSWIEINVITDDVTTSCSAKFLNFQQFLDVCRPDEQTSVSRFSSNCLDTLQDSEYAEIIDIERGDEEKELSEVQCSRTNELAGPVDFLGIIADSNDFSRNNPVPESSTQKEQTVSNGNLNKCRSIDFSSHRAENCKQSVTDNCDFEFDDEVWDTDLRGNHRSLRNKAYSIDLRPSGRDDGEFEVEIMNSCDEFSGVSNNDDQEFEVGNLNIGEEEGSESSEDSDDVRKTLNKSSNVNIVARRPSISNDNKKNCSVSLFSKKSSKPGKKQAYDKVHVCFFCNKELKCKMKRHILSVHRKEDVVQNILLLPKGIERTNMVNRLINEGNFKHNIEVIQRGEGQLVVGKRFGSTKKPSAYTACSFCKKFQSKKNLWRHNKTCPERIAYYSRHSDTNNGQNKRILAVKRGQALVNAAAFSSEDCNLSDLTDRMRDDDIKEICLADSLVRKEAELRLQGLGKKEDQKTDDIYRVSQAARLLGRIILQARETKPGITMSELIVPANFDFTVKVAKMLSTDKDKPALNVAKSIGFSLLKVCDTKYCQGLRDTDYQAQTDASDFKKLIETEWNLRVNRTALRCIQKEKRSKVAPIPLTEDLQKFRNYLLIQIRDLSEQLKRQCDAKTWVKLAKCTMSRLILFNKRRRAEVRELKVDEYINRPNWKDDVNGEMGKALTPTDRLLANRLKLTFNCLHFPFAVTVLK